jgi:hypothetical protein
VIRTLKKPAKRSTISRRHSRAFASANRRFKDEVHAHAPLLWRVFRMLLRCAPSMKILVRIRATYAPATKKERPLVICPTDALMNSRHPHGTPGRMTRLTYIQTNECQSA